MQFWIVFWQVTLIAALAVFAVLAVVVSIGGFKDVLALFRSIDSQHAREDAGAEQPEADAWQKLP